MTHISEHFLKSMRLQSHVASASIIMIIYSIHRFDSLLECGFRVHCMFRAGLAGRAATHVPARLRDVSGAGLGNRAVYPKRSFVPPSCLL